MIQTVPPELHQENQSQREHRDAENRVIRSLRLVRLDGKPSHQCILHCEAATEISNAEANEKVHENDSSDTTAATAARCVCVAASSEIEFGEFRAGRVYVTFFADVARAICYPPMFHEVILTSVSNM